MKHYELFLDISLRIRVNVMPVDVTINDVSKVDKGINRHDIDTIA